MGFVHVKKQLIKQGDDDEKTAFAVQAIAIYSPSGKKLIPNPSGQETCLYDTLEEAEAAIGHAGFDYIYEDRKVYLTDYQHVKTRRRHSGDSVQIEDAVPLLISRLRDKEPSVVANSAAALGELQHAAGVAPMAELLGHHDAMVRKSIAEALGKIGEPAIEGLSQAFEEAQKSKGGKYEHAIHVRLTVMGAYLEMTHSHLELVDQIFVQTMAALEDENWMVRAQAALVIRAAAERFREEALKG